MQIVLTIISVIVIIIAFLYMRKAAASGAVENSKTVGFVDAAVLAVTARLDEPKLATLDHRHFRALRPRHVDALQLLPEDRT